MKIKLKSIDIDVEINEKCLNDWRYMDYLTRSEDMSVNSVERFRSINKAMEMLMGMEQKDEALGKIAEKNDGFVSYASGFGLLREISEELKEAKK